MGVCLLLPETLDPSLSSDLRWQEGNSVIAKGKAKAKTTSLPDGFIDNSIKKIKEKIRFRFRSV